MRKMMKRIAAATIGMAIVMTSTACSSGTGSTTAAPENKETTAVQSAAEEKKEDPAAAPEETYTLMFGHAQTETHPYQGFMPRQKPIHIRHVSRNGLMRWRRKQTAVL